MSEHVPPPPDDLSAALSALQPRPAALDRDRLMFLAGQSAGAARCRRWRWATGAMTTAALALAVALGVRPGPEVRVVYLPAPPPAPAETVPDRPPADAKRVAEDTEPLAGVPAGRLQQAFLQAGLDTPAPPAGAESPGEEPSVVRHTASAWEWRRDIFLHPSILEDSQ